MPDQWFISDELAAAGYSTAETVDFFREKSPFKLSKLTVGKPGIIDTAKIRADFLEYFPEDSFESLERRLFVAATDIVNARLVIFESGPLISPLLALIESTSIIASSSPFSILSSVSVSPRQPLT